MKHILAAIGLACAPLLAQAPVIDGGSSWDGWIFHSNSQAPGTRGTPGTGNFDLYHTSFRLPAGMTVTGANRGNLYADILTGSYQAGDLIVGVGIRFKGTQRGTSSNWNAGVDRNNTDLNWGVGGNDSGTGFGGSAYVNSQLDSSKATRVNGGFIGMSMRNPALSSGTTSASLHGTSGTLNGSTSVNSWTIDAPAGGVIPNVWGQTYATYDAFARALPFRSYGFADGSGIVSMQWLFNSSAMDRAGATYSAPFQSWTNNWAARVQVTHAGGSSLVVLNDLPLLSYSFGTAQTTLLPSSAAPLDLALANFDGVAGTDFVAVAQTSAGPVLSVGKNVGGAFAAGNVSNVAFGNASGRPEAIVAGNFDSTAGIDVAVLTSNLPPASGENKVYIFSNDGSGVFTLGSTVTLTGMVAPSGIAAGNFNGGNDDLVVTDAGSGTLIAGTASVLLNGASGFTQSTVGTFTNACRGTTVADVNGDSNADVVIVESNTSTGVMHVLLGNGSGAFTAMAGSPFTTSANGQHVAATDLDVDGDADLAVSCTTDAFSLVNGTINVFVNNGASGLARNDYGALRGPVALAGGRFEDANATPAIGRDLAIANLTSGAVSLLGEWRSGAFSQGGIVRYGVTPTAVAIADIDNNGYGDLVYADASGLAVGVVPLQIMARVDSYGTGAAGTSSLTPVLSALGAPALPRLGYANFGLRMAQCRIVSPSVVVINDAIASPLTAGLPLIGGTSLASWLELSDVTGNMYVALPIPNSIVFRGLYLYAQGAVFDPNGTASFFPGLSLSQGLRLRVGE